jgi:hypothetical protein
MKPTITLRSHSLRVSKEHTHEDRPAHSAGRGQKLSFDHRRALGQTIEMVEVTFFAATVSSVPPAMRRSCIASGSGPQGLQRVRVGRRPRPQSQEAIDDVINSLPAEFCERMRRRWRIGLPGPCERW